jgi:tetratricopeptide (TPR) repeat protein
MVARINQRASLRYRFEQWKYTTSMIKENPFGVGAGNWWIVFPKYASGIEYPSAFESAMFRHPHNDFVLACAETGVLGALAYIGMFVAAIVKNKEPWLVFGLVGYVIVANFSGAYIGMFVAAIVKNKEPWLVFGLVGYVIVANFSGSHERAFASLMAATFIAMSFEGVRFKYVKLVIPVLLFALVVFGFRYRASCFNKQIKRATEWSEVIEYTKGRSVFSTLTYHGLPFYWWHGISALKTDDIETAKIMFEKAYKDNPYNIHVINGMGIKYGLEQDVKMARSYFKKAIDICPDFDDANKNLMLLE